MNTATDVKTAISSVIAPGGLRAMTLFSEWGTGKTYLVQRFFETKDAETKLKDAKLGFAYVSLFGAESIAEVRRRLTVAALKNSPHPILSKATLLGRIIPEKVSAKGVNVDVSKLGTLASEYIQDTVTRNLFVCIDDLERADQLSIQDLLGLVAELTEQRDCKCLLVFNRNKLSTDQTKKLTINEEKVFDLSVEYQPAIIDNLLHGFVDAKDRELAKHAFETFKNANIRIMKRAAWVLRALRENGAYDPLLWPKIVQHGAILTLLKHAHSAEIPNLADALDGTNEVARLFGEKDDEKIPASIRTPLDELQFEATPYDPIIIRLLEAGSLNKKDLDTAIEGARATEEKKKAQKELHSFWAELRAGFVKDSAHFVARLKKFLAESKDQISRAELAQICDLLLAIEPTAENKDLVAAKLAPIFLHVKVADRSASLDKFPAILAAEIHEAMPYDAKPPERILADAMKDIAGTDTGWDPKAYDDLPNFTNAEIRDYLLGLEGERAIFQARRLVERVPDQDSEKAAALRTRLKTIFDEIAARNSLNRFQVEYFVRPPAGQ
jgi:hypothetical protein